MGMKKIAEKRILVYNQYTMGRHWSIEQGLVELELCARSDLHFITDDRLLWENSLEGVLNEGRKTLGVGSVVQVKDHGSLD